MGLIGFFRKLFSTDFTPHGYCIRIPEVIWLHEVSDLVIAFSYFLIPLALIYLIRIRRDLVYPWLFSLFGLFIVSCGATHLLSVFVLWHPMYRLEGLVKAITALASLPTALLLFRVLPQAKRLPSAQLLRDQNAALGAEISERKRGEEKIRELNEQLQRQFSGVNHLLDAVLEALPLAVVISDPRGSLIRENQAHRELWGVAPERPSWEQFPEWVGFWPKSGARMEGQEWAISRALLNGDAVRGQLVEIERPGSHERRFVLHNAAPVRDGQGRIMAGVLAATDITEQRRTEEAIRENDATIRALLETASQAIIGVDPKGFIRIANKMAEQAFGYTRAELLGHPLENLLPEHLRAKHSGYRAQYTAGPRQRRMGEHQALVGQRKDGSRFPVEISLSYVDTREGVLSVAFITDTTERDQVAQALRDSEARFRQLADSMPQMVWTARPDGHVDYYNERWYEFTGLHRSTKGDESWIPIVHPDDLPAIREVWSAALAHGNMYELEYRFWDRVEKRWRWFIGRALPVRDRSGEIVKWFGTSTDIDVQKRVEDELRRANQDLEQFAYSASHDLKEPLRNLVIYSEVLRKRYGQQFDAEGEEFLQHLSEGARRISALLADLLAYTEAATLTTEVQPVNCAEIFQAVVCDLELEIKESSACVIESGLPTVSVNAVHVRQLFQNLISNALKYRSESEAPIVTVTARREKSSWHFLVQDNGIGIEPQYHKQIFGLFKRLHGRYGRYSGTGIGLAICQKIVERYGGHIWVDSELGGGSTFHFLLPGLPDQHER